ncbi:hypothetical protein [Natronococcus roseus]|uniref:hypothetical protein n=1 Tax=Natronococcus roseus TaxID=1052014 RepID=UPI00374D8DDC
MSTDPTHDKTELERREKIVITTLSEADNSLKTGEVKHRAADYDETIQHNKQISRVFDSLEEQGVIETEYVENDGVLADSRVASLTSYGEVINENIHVREEAVESLEEAVSKIDELLDDVDYLEQRMGTAGEISEIHGRIDIIEKRVNRAVEKADTAKSTADTLENEVSTKLDDQHSALNGFENRIEKLEERVNLVEQTMKNIKDTLQNHVRPAVEYVYDNARINRRD